MNVNFATVHNPFKQLGVLLRCQEIEEIKETIESNQFIVNLELSHSQLGGIWGPALARSI